MAMEKATMKKKFVAKWMEKNYPPANSIIPRPVFPVGHPKFHSQNFASLKQEFFLSTKLEPNLASRLQLKSKQELEPIRKSSLKMSLRQAKQPALEPAVETALEPALEPVLEPALEPGVETALEPALEPAFEPALEPALEPAFEPVLEPALEPAFEPVLEPALEPAMKLAFEPTLEHASEQESQLNLDPSSIPDPKPECESKMMKEFALKFDTKLELKLSKLNLNLNLELDELESNCAQELAASHLDPKLRLNIELKWKPNSPLEAPESTATAERDRLLAARENDEFQSAENLPQTENMEMEF